MLIEHKLINNFNNNFRAILVKVVTRYIRILTQGLVKVKDT